MGKVIAKYQVKIPSLLMEGDEVIELKPIESGTAASRIVIFPPGSRERKPVSVTELKHGFYNLETKVERIDSQLWNADTLWVQIEAEVAPGLSQDEIHAQLNTSMQQVVYRFLRLLRRKLPETPIFLPPELEHSASFKWVQMPAGQTLTTATVPFAFRVVSKGAGLTKEKWSELQQEVGSGADTELWEDFIVDSKVALEEHDPIRATLYAAIACETFIRQYIRKVATKADISEKFLGYLGSREPEIRAIRYYGPILHLVTGHSLEDENNELYKSLERLFTERNKIMHEGKRLYSDDEHRRLINDIRGGQQAIAWVQNLQ